MAGPNDSPGPGAPAGTGGEMLPAAEVAAELDQIRTIAQIDPAAFESDRSLHARWLELVEQQVAVQPAAPDEDLRRLAAGQGQGPAGKIVEEILPELRREFVEDFRSLPPLARQMMLAELAAPLPISAPVDAGDVEAFAAGEPAGAELVAEWGRTAARNIAVAGRRMLRALALMDPDSMDRALRWFDRLSPRSYKAVMRGLVTGKAAPGAPREAHDPRLDAVLAELQKTRAELNQLAARTAEASGRNERRMRRVVRDSEGRIAGFEEF